MMQRLNLDLSTLLSLLLVMSAAIQNAHGAAISDGELNKMRQQQKDSFNTCGSVTVPCLHAVRVNFPVECLSNPLCEISIKAVFQKDGPLKSEIVSAKNNSPSDDFYCQQAVAEYMIKRLDNTPMLFDFNAKMPPNPSMDIFKQTPDDCIALHLIPHTFPGSSFTFPEPELNGKNNILYLKKSKLDDPRVQSFRKDWFTFMANHKPLTHKDVSAEARLLHKRYADLFE